MGALRRYIASTEEGQGARIVGHIGGDTGKKWLAWELGELYTVGWHGNILFCVSDGTVVFQCCQDYAAIIASAEKT